MLVFERKAELSSYLIQKRLAGSTIGYVPTMGALHQGHLSLIEASAAQADLSLCSIFVNPTQFNNSSDLEKYPRTLEKDIDLLKAAGCQVLYCPTREEMYPNDTHTSFSFGPLEQVMEGYYRPGHFHGVGLVISKFFNTIRPDIAFFGQKDLQQCRIIEQLTADLFFDVRIVIVPTTREEDGLAMSSRNMRLNAEQRSLAPHFYKALCIGAEKLRQGMEPKQLTAEIKDYFAQFPALKLEYFCVADSGTLQPVDRVPSHGQLALCIAGYVGEIRLIDNLLLVV
jgi:pantoate--beta-alanine ligase